MFPRCLYTIPVEQLEVRTVPWDHSRSALLPIIQERQIEQEQKDAQGQSSKVGTTSFLKGFEWSTPGDRSTMHAVVLKAQEDLTNASSI